MNIRRIMSIFGSTQGDRQDAAAGKDYSEEFTPSEAEAIHRAMVREEQGRQSEERGE